MLQNKKKKDKAEGNTITYKSQQIIQLEYNFLLDRAGRGKKPFFERNGG